ncbi:hypothetical protein HYDPIDRAFT_111501 [Hydnomerulius pinastri MD-312]|uniref:Uncharacterized protein n=1 Tax=Hydnomerulius pinastri MD-312 TaxID=994086 RepID=A0A0C9WG59_9AGAM|nr:hypothetical protein HYDPIDRAFT_111501 [Hydnomerulius pinastri MD-312]
MVILVRKAVHIVDILRPLADGFIWKMVENASNMHHHQKPRGEQKEREDSVVKTRSATPSSSFSTRTRALYTSR